MILNKSEYKICIIGLGYVGLPLASRFSQKGFDIVGFDIDKSRVNELKKNSDKNNDFCDDELRSLNKNSKLT